MSQQQQTVLKVQTNKPNFSINLPEGDMTISSTGTTMLVIGAGTITNPYTGLTISGSTTYGDQAYFDINNGGGTIYYVLSGQTYDPEEIWQPSYIYLIRNSVQYLSRSTTAENNTIFGSIDVKQDDRIRVSLLNGSTGHTSMPYLYFVPNDNSSVAYEDLVLDLYGDIPIKINRSFAELQDIAKKNSDYSIGLSLPGSKRNNQFFESFFNVDVDTLYFNPLLRTPAKVLINDEIYFTGYLKLNKISVLDSKVEYDVTLFSSISDLFGKIGNNLLKDLPYGDPTNNFNHNFSPLAVSATWDTLGFNYGIKPSPYIYPIVHNGYNYTGDTVNLSGDTFQSQTRLYTTSAPIGAYPNSSAMYAAGVTPYRLNTRGTSILDNQLKPALNLWSIMQLMFQTYGYTIKSDFMNTPWMKGLYMYGYFNSDTTKFSYTTDISQYSNNTQSYKLSSVSGTTFNSTCGEYDDYVTYTFTIVNAITGVPEAATQPYTIAWYFTNVSCVGAISFYTQYENIFPGQTSVSFTWNPSKWVPCGEGCATKTSKEFGQDVSNSNLFQFNTSNAPQTQYIYDGDYVDFSLIINNTIKQIDILASIAKKFNLVFVPDPNVPNQIIVEPYQYYVGTGSIYDWTDKLSYDKGWSVQPALNFVESELIFTDLEDGDDGNKQFKDKNNRIYGQNYVFNQTDFKSQTKKIETIFSPQITRKWDNNVAIPLGINYVSANSPDASGDSEKVRWTYKGVKTKPKIFYYLGNKNVFLNTLGESYNSSYVWATNYIYIAGSNGGTGGYIDYINSTEAPVISNTMPLGNPDTNKINNDSICILFNSELPTDVGVETFDAVNAYTDQDMYNLFYENRINNLYNPNTRFLEGYFWLKLNDIKNLKANDIIKIKEQYFTWNKINEYNLTDRELTKVELIQIDNNPSTYPTRYFQYNYCAQPSYKYNIKTDFTNPQMNLTHFYISNWYDYYVGLLGGSVSSVTSSFRLYESSPVKMLPFTMYEVTKDVYESTGNPYTTDPNVDWDIVLIDYKLTSYWTNSGYTKQGINLWANCTDFYTTASANNILVATPSGGTPGSIYSLAVTINVTDTGWIKYNTAEFPDGTYTYFGSLGNVDIPGCVDCTSIRYAYPFADLGSWTIVDCGVPC